MLTQKKRLYAQARFKGKGVQDAAFDAGVAVKSCARTGGALEKDPDVKEYLARLRSGEEKMKEDVEIEPAPPIAKAGVDPMDFLIGIMNDLTQDPKLRVDAAKAVLPYKYRKLGDVGKKEQQQKDAEKVSKFKPRVINT